MKEKKGKRLLITGAVIVCVAAVLFCSMSQMPAPADFTIRNIDFSSVADGTYLDQAENGPVNAKVSVSVSNGSVTDIALLEHDNLLGKKAESITQAVIKAQSLDVDAISSATHSSNTILKAIEKALTQQGGN